MDEALQELINAIKDLSPAVWDAALVRVQVKGWLDFGLAGVFLLASIGFIFLARQFAKRADLDSLDDTSGGMAVLCIFGGLFCLIPIIGNLYYGLLYLFSPEWSAIQLILEQVKQRG